MSRSRPQSPKIIAASILALSAAALLALAVSAQDHGDAQGDQHGAAAHWGYDGDSGPEHWGDLATENAACAAGVQQSPIDLSSAVAARVASPTIEWSATNAASIVHNGHTLQVNVSDAGGLFHGDTPYELKQFHFHHVSEHTVDGAHYPLEIHFVHQSPDGALAVIGVFVEEGEENEALTPLWAAAPHMPGAAPLTSVDPRALLSGGDDQFHYAGSLTTPPCSEIVTWTLQAEPIQASAEQIALFAELFPANNRPIQPRNRRFVLSTE